MVECHPEKFDEHDLDDGTQAACGGADGRAEDGRLSDRGVAYPIRAELLEETGGHLEHASGLGDILTEHDDGWIGGHLLANGKFDRIAHGELHRALRVSLAARSSMRTSRAGRK